MAIKLTKKGKIFARAAKILCRITDKTDNLFFMRLCVFVQTMAIKELYRDDSQS